MAHQTMTAPITTETMHMIINRAIVALEMAARTLNGVENAAELVEAAVARHSIDVARSVSSVSDMISNASIDHMISSPQATAVVRVATSNRRPVVEQMPLSFGDFSHFAMAVEEGATPIAVNEFIIVPVLYNSGSYRNRVEKKDATAPKFGAYKAAKEAAYKARGVCFDRDAFMAKAEGVASSIKAKTAMWANYCVCRDLLMGFKKYAIVRHTAGERPAKRSRKAATVTVENGADELSECEATDLDVDHGEDGDVDDLLSEALAAPAVASVADAACVAAPAVALVADTAGVAVPAVALVADAGVTAPPLVDDAAVIAPPLVSDAGVTAPPLVDDAGVTAPPLVGDAAVSVEGADVGVTAPPLVSDAAVSVESVVGDAGVRVEGADVGVTAPPLVSDGGMTVETADVETAGGGTFDGMDDAGGLDVEAAVGGAFDGMEVAGAGDDTGTGDLINTEIEEPHTPATPV